MAAWQSTLKLTDLKQFYFISFAHNWVLQCQDLQIGSHVRLRHSGTTWMRQYMWAVGYECWLNFYIVLLVATPYVLHGMPQKMVVLGSKNTFQAANLQCVSVLTSSCLLHAYYCPIGQSKSPWPNQASMWGDHTKVWISRDVIHLGSII